MQIWNASASTPFTPPGHFGGLEVLDIVGFKGRKFSVQVSKAPPGAGGELHHHEQWAQVFYVVKGELTFDTGNDRFTLREGESVLFEPRDPHATLNEGGAESVSLVITIDQG
jgi:mannose-6-phosphate isomerase-like protein (cupin superfamily)